MQAQLQQQLALLEQKLAEKDRHCRELQDALGQTREQLEDHWKGSVGEKQRQYDQLRESQKDSDFAMQQMRQDLEAAQDKIRAMQGEKKNFESLMDLYEQVKQERDELRKECFSAAVEAETAKRTQAELSEQLRQHAIDHAATEKLAEELFKEKDGREQAERELKSKEDQFNNELSLRDKQLELSQEAYQQGQKAGRDEMELRLREAEREKVLVDEELARIRDELFKQTEQAQRAREESIAKDKEIKDWCSAFQTAEKHKVSMSMQHDELKAERNQVQQEKVAMELRSGVLQQHVDRLERQLREEQERSDRLTQAHAEKELGLAQKELEYRDRELKLREQAARQKEMLEREHAAASQAEKEKIRRELEMLHREAELRDQAQHREQDRVLQQSAQEVAAKELEITALKRELGQLRTQQGQLQTSLQSALGQVAALGQEYQQAAAGVVVDAGGVSPLRPPPGGPPPPHSPGRALLHDPTLPQITHEVRYPVPPQALTNARLS